MIIKLYVLYKYYIITEQIEVKICKHQNIKYNVEFNNKKKKNNYVKLKFTNLNEKYLKTNTICTTFILTVPTILT